MVQERKMEKEKWKEKLGRASFVDINVFGLFQCNELQAI